MRALLVLVLLWVAVEAAVEAQASKRGPTGGQVEAVLRDWPQGPRQTALGLMDRLGVPQGARGDAVWWDGGESRIVVYRTPPRGVAAGATR